MLRALILILTGLIPVENGGLSPELKPPVRLEAAGKPIDTDIGHAARLLRSGRDAHCEE